MYEDYDGQETKEDFSLRLAYHYDRKLSESTAFFHNFEILPSLEDIKSFLAKTDVGLKVDITKSMFLEGKIELTHNSDPAPGNLRNDVKYILALGWKF